MFFVDLAPISDTGAVVGAVAAALPLLAGGEQMLLESIVDWLGDRHVMLMIDNCEHLLAEVGVARRGDDGALPEPSDPRHRS